MMTYAIPEIIAAYKAGLLTEAQAKAAIKKVIDSWSR